MWTNESLKKVIKDNFQDYKFIMVSNREPFAHSYDEKKKVVANRTVGGVAITLDSIMKATKGTWIAYGGGEADKAVVNEDDQVRVPPNKPQYTLRRIWIDPEKYQRYYDGFSNQTLWPLCHVVFKRPTFNDDDWKAYKEVNKQFADAVLREIGREKAIVWVHDYQLSLVAKYIKEKRPDVIVAQFWHIPWPTHEIFRICPWKKEIITGLLSNDLLGFQRYYHVDNFLSTVAREVGGLVDREDLVIEYKNHRTRVNFFPISVDYHDILHRLRPLIRDRAVVERYVPWKYETLAIGIDRIDYTKGLIGRMAAIEKFLELNPDQRGKFVYLGIAAPSRETISEYQKLNTKLQTMIFKINERFGQKDWQPIVFVAENLKRNDILQISRIADLCLVTSLDDGMNLVAKEYVVANNGLGSLILSPFAGAAKELADALLVNPYDVRAMAKAIKEALAMPVAERKERMEKMKAIVEHNNVFRWSSKFLLSLAAVKAKNNSRHSSKA